ncbi:MAG: ABC transporter permease [Candidatus Cloacimonetes bacterium]|nr:ABC transporter permease [Candidatus Cloacimonadota bacterium]
MKFGFLFKESWTALKSSFIRTILTMLGVIIGVAAVIAMMSIGGGAQEETIKQIRSLGANNVYVKSSRLSGDALKNAKELLSEGLTRNDLSTILKKTPYLLGGTFEAKFNGVLKYQKNEPKVNLIGIGANYFELVPAELRFGRLFSSRDFEDAYKGVILGAQVSTELFGNLNPVGKLITIKGKSFKIIGVILGKHKAESAIKSGDIKIGERETSRDVYFPYSVIQNRFPLVLSDKTDSENDPTYSELSTLIIKLKDPNQIVLIKSMIQKILDYRHKGVDDYQIIAPVDLLEKSNKVQDIFNLVMIFIAGLSLLVGGIGIMNIMLANIQQRIKEIGIRRAIGATKEDILVQFLFEAVLISVGGGVLGVFFGIAISYGISIFTGWSTVLSVSSIVISFIVSVTVGLIFGIFPARKASEMDPITALRYE